MSWQHKKRDNRARELKSDGKVIIGYFCCYTPTEILTAGGAIPYRIMGLPEEYIPEADSHLESTCCPFVRNCTGLMLKGDMEFLDGIVVPHTCDSIQRCYGFWKQYSGLSYIHYLEVPHTISKSSISFLAREIEEFNITLETFLRKDISRKDLTNAIVIHNENRSLVRELYELRKSDPPLMTGTQVMDLLLEGLAMPIAEFNELIKVAVTEAQNKANVLRKGLMRLLIYGCVIDSPHLLDSIERHNINIVMDDLSIGSRTFWFDVKTESDPFHSLADAYLRGIRCPRTIVGKKESRPKDLAQRFGYLINFIREYNVTGVIAHNMSFCDCHSFDAPDLIEYLGSQDIPVLGLDSDYTQHDTGQLSNRLQAFVEMVEPIH